MQRRGVWDCRGLQGSAEACCEVEVRDRARGTSKAQQWLAVLTLHVYAWPATLLRNAGLNPHQSTRHRVYHITVLFLRHVVLAGGMMP